MLIDQQEVIQSGPRGAYGPRFTPSAPRAPSPRDLEVFQAVVDYKRANDGCAPSTKQLQRLCTIASSSGVHLHMANLERDGLIVRGPGSCQIRVTGGRWALTKE